MSNKEFCRAHPVNDKIEDADVFIHATSSDNYDNILNDKMLKCNSGNRNYTDSEQGIYFDKYSGTDLEKQFNRETKDLEKIPNLYKTACRNDGSSELVILEITGMDLKKLQCPIIPDYHDGFTPEWEEEKRVGIKDFIAIVIEDKDIPLKCLKVFTKLAFNE